MADEINNLTEDQLWNMSDDDLEQLVTSQEFNTSEQEQETDEEEETAVDDLEQPEDEQDSDDNASDEDEVDTEDSEETSEEETDEGEDETAEESQSESDEEQSAEEEDDTTEEESQPTKQEKLVFKANGREFEFTPDEVLERFPQVFGQAMDYTRKTQAIKPWRKQIDALEQNEIKPEDLNLMIDALKGNKDAVTEMLKRTGIDALDLNVEEAKDYVPQDYGRDDKTLDLQEVLQDISRDPEYERTNRVLTSEWDDTSWNELAQNPAMIRGLHVDVKSGMYDKLMPTVDKLKLYDGGRKSDLEYYTEAAQMYSLEQERLKVEEAARQAERERAEAEKAKQEELASVKAKQATVQAEKSKAPKRKAAAPVNKSAGGKKTVDYLDDSDEAFEEWYKQVQESV